jgi:hypothetical protein
MATKVNTGKKGGSKMFWIIGGLVLIAGGVGAYFLLRKPKDDTNTNTDTSDDGDKDKSTDGGGNTGSGSGIVSSSVSAPAELNSADKIKAFQDWMDAQGKGWINKDGKWVLLNKGEGYGTYGKNTDAVWKVYGKQYVDAVKGGSADVPAKLKPFVDRKVISAKNIKSSSFGKYVPYSYKSPNGNTFTFNFLENGYFKVLYPKNLADQYKKTIAYEGSFEDGGRTLKIKKDDYGFDSKDFTGTTLKTSSLSATASKLFQGKSSFAGITDELEFANFDNNLDLNL